MIFDNYCYKLTVFKNHYDKNGIYRELSKSQFLELLTYDIRTH